MLISPVKKAAIPEVAATSIGIVRIGLLKNVSPPRCPEATRIPNDARDIANAKISQVERVPNLVLGLK